MSMEIPTDEAMKMMAKMAIEQATEMFADMADRYAADPLMKGISGEKALTAFAAAIRSTNAKQFPRSDAQ